MFAELSLITGPMMKRVAKFKEVLTKVGYEKVLVEIQAFFSKDKAGGFYGAEMSLIWLHGIHDDMRHIGQLFSLCVSFTPQM